MNQTGGGGGGGGYSTDAWVGRCGPGAQTLILFTTQISDFPISLRQNSDFSDTVYHTLYTTLSAARPR